MFKKSVIFILLIIIILNQKLFTLEIDREAIRSKMLSNSFLLNFDFIEITRPDSIKDKGNIFINVRNIRSSKDLTTDILYENNNFIGYFLNGYFENQPILTHQNNSLDKIFSKIIGNSLEYNGYNVLDKKPDGTIPILEVEITDFYLDGFIGYGIFIDYNLILKTGDGKKELLKSSFKTEIGYSLYFAGYEQMYNAIQLILAEVLFQSILFIDTDKFSNSYSELVENEINHSFFKDKKLIKIPTDLNKSINYLDLSSNNISKINNLDKLNNLYFLNLKSNNINDIENLNNLSSLTGLNLRNNNLRKIENLDNLKNLKMLVLAFNSKISKLENLEKLNNLIYLSLNYLDDVPKIQGLENLKNLKFLDLSKVDDIKKIENLEGLTNLEVLNLNFVDLKKIQGLDNLVNLKELYLSANYLKVIENLDNLKNLETLDISMNNIKKIENLDNLVALKKLKFSGDMSDILRGKQKGISKIENLDRLVNLEELDLSFNIITKIENLENLKNLKKLDITFNKIKKIENLENLKNLESVIFSMKTSEHTAKIWRPKEISRKTFDFLKEKKVIIDEKMEIEEYIKTNEIKIVD